LLADIPAAEQPAIEIMRTDTATWRKLVEASRHAIGGWAVRSALHSNICNRTHTDASHPQPCRILSLRFWRLLSPIST
jgi:hypothetical protein